MSVAATGKVVTISASGATIDTNGNSMEYDSNFGTGVGGVTFVDTASTHGTININANTGYTGNTTIGAGADVNLGNNGNLSAGSTANAFTIVASGGKLSGGTTQVTQNAEGTGGAGSNNAGKITLQSGGIVAPGNITGNGAGGTAAAIAVSGKGLDTGGNGNQSGNAANNVLNAQQLTWNAGGKLQFLLDSTSQQGTILNPSASTLLNLGSGALVKNGTGQFVLDFQNTGNYNTLGHANANGTGALTDFTNVYDLINFGVTSNSYGVYSPNTTFGIDDFSIINLNGIGTLSFYYNPLANGGANGGQEELLLTVVPEPSTWAMLLGGLVALVFWTRKRTRRTASLRKA
jgi:hypothetical protein